MEKVDYEIRFHEQGLAALSSNGDKAGNSLDNLTKKSGGLNMSLGGLIKTVGLVGLAWGAFNFLSESVSDFNAAAQASAQLNATLESTGYSAGLSRAALDSQAEALAKVTKYDDDAIASMQSLLLTFTDIKGAVFQEATPAILDLAEKMQGDLKGASIQVGKALNDPIKGVTALSKVGVSFTEQQKAVIKTMVDTGNVAGAQRIILAELNKEFGGSAEAGAKAGTGGLTVLANRFGNIKESIGGLIVQGLEKLYPVLSRVMDIIEAAPGFVKEWNKEIKALGIFVGVVAAGWTLYTIAVNAVAAATFVYEGAQWLLNIALTANPVGLVIVGIAALTAGIWYAWEASETFRSTLYGLWEAGKMVFDIFTAVGKALIFPTPENITGAIDALANIGDIGDAYKNGKAKGLASFEADKQARAEEEAEQNKKDEAQKKRFTGKATTSAAKISKPSSMAAASKPIQINIQIGNLVENINIYKEFKEATQQMKTEIVKALVSGVNDFQRTAGA